LIVAYGTASELKSQIGGEMLEVTLAHRSDLPRAIEVLKKISTGEPKVDAESLLVAVAIQSGTSGLMEALRGLDQAGVEVGDMGLRRPTLDDVFLTLTAKPVKLAPAIRALQPAGEPDAPLALPGPLALPPLPLSCCDEAAALGAEAALAVPRAPTSPPGRNRARHIARSFSKAASDFAVIGKRNLLRYIRLPNLLVASAIQPVMIVLLFTYVFGGVMKIYLHGSYIDYLMPGAGQCTHGCSRRLFLRWILYRRAPAVAPRGGVLGASHCRGLQREDRGTHIPYCLVDLLYGPGYPSCK
jgi:ABC-2 type transport system ATP-binding protein